MRSSSILLLSVQRCCWLLRSGILAAFMCSLSVCYGAQYELISEPKSNGEFRKFLVIKGEIRPGEAARLVDWVFMHPDIRLPIVLDSPGGSVLEAIRMSEIVKTLRVSTRVQSGGVCASACFFVWMAGANRLASGSLSVSRFGRIGLHRPFLKSPENSAASLAIQTNLANGVASYLAKNLVSRRLIDLMMSRPSNDIYWLTFADLEELGSVPPELEELYIAKCKYDRRLIERLAAAELRSDKKLAAELESRSVEASDCQGDLDADASRVGRLKILSGWMPKDTWSAESK